MAKAPLPKACQLPSPGRTVNVESLLTSPHLIDLILLLTLLEAIIIVALKGLSAPATLRILLQGVFVLLALRAALAGAPWPWVPAALAASLAAHLWELKTRWKR